MYAVSSINAFFPAFVKIQLTVHSSSTLRNADVDSQSLACLKTVSFLIQDASSELEKLILRVLDL